MAWAQRGRPFEQRGRLFEQASEKATECQEERQELGAHRRPDEELQRNAKPRMRSAGVSTADTAAAAAAAVGARKMDLNNRMAVELGVLVGPWDQEALAAHGTAAAE